jgi:hypothetical protein
MKHRREHGVRVPPQNRQAFAARRVPDANVAVFSGRDQPASILARGVDPGDLVSADSTARELFHLMQTDILRVFVDMPQVFVTGIQVGQRAVVYRSEDPLKPFSGK